MPPYRNMGVFLATLFAVGCTASVSPGDSEAAALTVVETGHSAPLRLTQSRLTAAQVLQRDPLTIPPEKGRMIVVTGEGGVERRGWQVDLDGVAAEHYNELRLGLRVSRGNQCRLTWTSDLEPEPEANPGISFPVLSDGDPHEYRLSLGAGEAETWQGMIAGLVVIVSADEDDTVVESLTLAYRPPLGPDRITLDHITMEALRESPITWQVTVPPGGILKTHVGMLPRSWKELDSDGVVFRIRAEPKQGSSSVLVEEPYTPKTQGNSSTWVPLEADLSAYADQTVQLVFETDPLSSYVGDYAVWGNPMVLSGTAKPSTPVILISIDTLRADHLSCYGYTRETSPHLDAFAREAVQFENVITPETWTLTAHVSMLTGLYPIHHGVNANRNLAESIQTLPEVLSAAGYVTGGFTGYRIWMAPHRGLAHGFDCYSTPDIVRDIFVTQAMVEPWVQAHHEHPFFLFFHNYDLHSKYDELGCEGCDLPYYPPDASFLHFSKEAPIPSSLRRRERPKGTNLLFAALNGRETISAEELRCMENLYDDAIRAVDTALAAHISKLKALGIYDKSLIIVTADHGEQFGEHDEYLHEHVYEGSARVPLLIKFPDGKYAGHKIVKMVQLIDLVPTVLDVLGIEGPAVDGESLVPIIEGADPKPWSFIQRQSYRAVRSYAWKLIKDTKTDAVELYHLATDPREERNIYDQPPSELPPLAAELERFFGKNPEGWHVAFSSTRPDWRGTVALSTAGPIDAATILTGGRAPGDVIKVDDHTATVTLGLLADEEVLIRTASSGAQSLLTVRSDSPFTVLLAGAEAFTGTEYEAVLDPDGARGKPEPAAVPEADRPLLLVWYEPAAAEGTSARKLTPEEQEVLNALGYGGEISKKPPPAVE